MDIKILLWSDYLFINPFVRMHIFSIHLNAIYNETNFAYASPCIPISSPQIVFSQKHQNGITFSRALVSPTLFHHQIPLLRISFKGLNIWRLFFPPPKKKTLNPGICAEIGRLFVAHLAPR